MTDSRLRTFLVLLLSAISIFLFMITATLGFYVIPELQRLDKDNEIVCRAAEQIADDLATSNDEERRSIERRRRDDGSLTGADAILLTNNFRSQKDILTINLILDQECP